MTNYIICLKGIDPNEYADIEDIFEQQIKESAELTKDIDPVVQIEFDQIPPQFTSIDSYPITTNLKCWHCDFTFMSRPVFIPTYITKTGMGTLGNFCSFSCASSYITNQTDVDKEYAINLLNLYKIFNCKDVNYIPPAPKKYIMQKYGGYLSDEKYLAQISNLEKNLKYGNDIKESHHNQKEITNTLHNELLCAWDLC